MRGDERQFEARVVPIDDNEVVTIVRDATELRETERELRAAHERLVSARDAERRRLERNLHDGAQQRLVVRTAGAPRGDVAPPGRVRARRVSCCLRAEEQLALAIDRDPRAGARAAPLRR